MPTLFFDGCGLTLERVAIGREQLDHLRKDARVGCDHLAPKQIAALTLEIADQTAGFDDQKTARCHVPRVQADFPETVVITGGDVRQIERSCTGPSQHCGSLEQVLPSVETALAKPTVPKWKASADAAYLHSLASQTAYASFLQNL